MFVLIPYGTADKPRRQPLVTFGIILVGLIGYLAIVAASDSMSDVFMRWGYVPNQAAPLTLLASIFLHAGLLHLIPNLWILGVAGPLIESRLGHGPFFLLYLAGGLAAFGLGGALSVGEGRITPHIGASGAIAAILGAFVVLYPFGDVKVWYFVALFWHKFWSGTWNIAGVFLFGIWFIIQLGTMALECWGGRPTSNTDVAAHFGGFLFGALAAAIAFGKEGLRRETTYGDL